MWLSYYDTITGKSNIDKLTVPIKYKEFYDEICKIMENALK